MNILTKQKARKEAEDQLDRQIQKMMMEADSKEALDDVLDVMTRREAIRKDKWRISPDTLATIGANLLGIILIINHERIHVISTKAISFVTRGRV